MSSRRRAVPAKAIPLALAVAASLLAPPAARAVHVEQDRYSLRLDGDGDMVRVAHADGLNLAPTFTLEAWVRLERTTGCQTIVTKGFDTSWWLGMCGGDLTLRSAGGSSPGSVLGKPIPTGLWTHVAATYDGTRNLREYFINGEALALGVGGFAPPPNTQPVTIGGAPYLQGQLGEVRVWNRVRARDEIRRTMHVALTEPLPGLVASWSFDTRNDGIADRSFQDSIGGHHGIKVNDAQLGDQNPSPPMRRFAAMDEVRNVLPWERAYAANVYVPGHDVAIVAGGGADGVLSSAIHAINATTGEQLPAAGVLPMGDRVLPAAAYVPDDGQVYMFGGGTGTYSDSTDTIASVDPVTARATLLPFKKLPFTSRGGAAVYHAGHRRTYVLGGLGKYTPESDIRFKDDIVAFHPDTGVQTVAAKLPAPAGFFGASYSHATGGIYLFGGAFRDGTNYFTDAVYKLTLAPDGSGSATVVARLPKAMSLLSAAEDPHTGLIYVAGGEYIHVSTVTGVSRQVFAFDPVAEKLWELPVRLPRGSVGGGVVYSEQSRQLVVLGGKAGATAGFDDATAQVIRIPLGDGPLTPSGRWDFPAPLTRPLTAIDGDDRRVLIGTRGAGAVVESDDATRVPWTPSDLASDTVNDVEYVASRDEAWIATETGGAKRDVGADRSIENTFLPAGRARVLSIEVDPQPDARDRAAFYGTIDGLKRWSCVPILGREVCNWESRVGGQELRDVVRRGPGAGIWALGGTNLWQPYGGAFGGAVDRGHHCALGFDRATAGQAEGDLAFDGSGSLWLVTPGVFSDSQTDGEGVCFVPLDAAGNPTGPGQPMRAALRELGDRAFAADTDADGRVWVAVNSATAAGDPGDDVKSGGLAVFENRAGRVRSSELDWQHAPIGTASLLTTSSPTLGSPRWHSGFSAVGAADERVWAGDQSGRLVTYAPRWHVIDEANGIGGKAIERIFIQRGRAFLVSGSELRVLEPDGKTWDNRSGVDVRDVIGDRSGRTWVATSGGVRLYTPDGWDLLSDKEGSKPSGAVSALAEDRDGQVWIGGAEGLALFGHDRFVLTLTKDNSPLPATAITALHADADGRLWVGTDSGLARYHNGTWKTFTFSNGLPSNRIRDIVTTSDRRIAVATEAQVALSTPVDPGAGQEPGDAGFETQTLPSPVSKRPLAVDGEGNLWAAGAVLRGDSWQGHWSTNSGLRHTTVSDVTTDGSGRVWFAHGPRTGISVRNSYLPPLETSRPVITGLESACPGSTSSRVCGNYDQLIKIRGNSFGSSVADVKVTLGGAAAEVRRVTDGEIEVRSNMDVTSGVVTVSVAGSPPATLRGPNSGPSFCAVPWMANYSPTGGNDGVDVTVTGANFDRSALVYLGGTVAHRPRYMGPRSLQTVIGSGDGAGQVRVENRTPGCEGFATSIDSRAGTFRRIDVQVSRLILNQGIPRTGLVEVRQAAAHHLLTVTPEPRTTDKLDFDSVELTLTEPGGREAGRTIHRSCAPAPGAPCALNRVTVPTVNGTAARALGMDITTMVTLGVFIPQIEAEPEPEITVGSVIKKNGAVVATATAKQIVRKNYPLKVLFVPIMRNGYTQADLDAVKAQVDADMGEFMRRIWPTGHAEPVWSHMAFTVDDVLHTEESRIELDDIPELYEASHELDEARRFYNDRHEPDALLAFGVVDALDKDGNNNADIIEDDSAPGYGFWPNTSQIISVAADTIDFVCDAGAFVASIFFDNDECELDLPTYVAWGASDGENLVNRVSDGLGHIAELFAHEMGHNMSLVGGDAPNGDLLDNAAHSITDEIGDGNECADGGPYDPTWSLYRSQGVDQPIINPLAPPTGSTDMQLRNTPGDHNTPRAKAIMAYACGQDSTNVFFEPADYGDIFDEMADEIDPDVGASSASFTRLGSRPLPAPQPAPATVQPQAPPSQPRLYVSGTVRRDGTAGGITGTRPLGEGTRRDASWLTGWTLDQLDAAGKKIASTGVHPQFRVSHRRDLLDDGFFASTIVLANGTAKVELRKGDRVLDFFAPGSAIPAVTLAGPAGGDFRDGAVPVTWVGTDPDGDALEAAISYSHDDGATWTVMKTADGSGTVPLPVGELAGSTRARVRVEVTDGLHSASAVSGPFSVAGRPPIVTIGQPSTGAMAMEGRQLVLSGRATDNLDGTVPGGRLRWRSDRDGELGVGAELPVTLTVGTHRITLEATNGLGLSATDTAMLRVTGDYDGDGLTDAEEIRDGGNPLLFADAYADADGDNLPLVMERRQGTNPARADTDGDGRRDDTEIEQATDPKAADAPPPTDHLKVYPQSVSIDADMSKHTLLLPQRRFTVASLDAHDWSASADVDWLHLTTKGGETIQTTNVVVKTFDLDNGTHTGKVTFTSTQLGETVEVPVTVKITNRDAYFDTSRDGWLDIGDVQGVAGRVPTGDADASNVRAYDIDNDGDVDVDDASREAARWTTGRSCCNTAYPAGPAAVSLVGPSRVAPGETFTVAVDVSASAGTGGFELDLDHDPARLELVSAATGPFLGTTGRTVAQLGPLAPAAGKTGLGGYSHGTAHTASGSGNLALLTFKALSEGTTALMTSNVLLASASGDVSTAQSDELTISIGAVQAGVHDAGVQSIAAPGHVGSPDRREVKAQVINRGEGRDQIRVYIDAVPPGGADNPYGCEPAGRIADSTVEIDAGTGAPVFADSGTAGDGKVDFACEDQAGAAGNSYTIVAAADVHGDDSGACPAGALRSEECRAALADDDEADDNNVMSRACCDVTRRPKP